MSDERTEADAVRDLAFDAAGLEEIEPGKVYDAVTSAGASRDVVDAERFDSKPSRSRGTVTTFDAESFVRAVRQRLINEVVVYADETSSSLVGVLNDDEEADPGWRDYRVRLSLRATPEWTFWKARQGLGDQEKFAETIEEGLDEVAEPEPSTMLEIAQSFHASTSSRFSGGQRLATGERQLLYSEEVSASAGSKAGAVSFPELLVLGVRPYLGTEPERIEARLRFRLREGKLTIGYVLHRPEEVERRSFLSMLAAVREELTEATYIAGSVPETEPRR